MKEIIIFLVVLAVVSFANMLVMDMPKLRKARKEYSDSEKKNLYVSLGIKSLAAAAVYAMTAAIIYLSYTNKIDYSGTAGTVLFASVFCLMAFIVVMPLNIASQKKTETT